MYFNQAKYKKQKTKLSVEEETEVCLFLVMGWGEFGEGRYRQNRIEFNYSENMW